MRERWVTKTGIAIILILTLSLILSACLLRRQPAPAATPSAPPATSPPTRTPQPTITPPPTLTATSSPTPLPTATATPKPGDLDVQCYTPMSLMLHTAFGKERMQSLAEQIILHEMQTITYGDVLRYLQQGECPPENAVIVSIDDLGTNWLQPNFKYMIQVFLDNDLKLVVGTVVQEPQNPIIWEYLQTVEGQGVEIASHTIHHYQLSALTDEALDEEISGSYGIICENLEHCPISLILPFGDGYQDERVMIFAEEYVFVSGIAKGLNFEGSPPYYVGRIGPNVEDQAITINLLQNTFLP
jgi:hypothetical protein